MAANVNPSRSHTINNNANNYIGCSGGGSMGANIASGNYSGDGVSVIENSITGPSLSGLRHNPGLSFDWTSEEQAILENLLMKYASDTPIVRYPKIAQELKQKTVRDVALRCRWMTENGKRRKDDQSSSKRYKDKKEIATDLLHKSSQIANGLNGPPYASSMMSMDVEHEISYKTIGGASGQLLEHNAHTLNQISANFASLMIHENINLFQQVRNNILLLNDCSGMPEIMKQMPPLPVMLDEELFKTVLGPTSLP